MLRLFSLLLILAGGFFAVTSIYGRPGARLAQPAPLPPVAAAQQAPAPAPAEALAPAVQRIVESVPVETSRPVILENAAPSAAMAELAALNAQPARISRAASGGRTAEAEGFYRQVTVQRANVREGPSTRDPVVGRLSMGDEVAVLGDDGSGWLLIRVEGDGVEGWISARLLSE